MTAPREWDVWIENDLEDPNRAPHRPNVLHSCAALCHRLRVREIEPPKPEEVWLCKQSSGPGYWYICIGAKNPHAHYDERRFHDADQCEARQKAGCPKCGTVFGNCGHG